MASGSGSDCGDPDQAEAAAMTALVRLSEAAAHPDLAIRAGMLAVAAEFAIRSVAVAWGNPVTKPRRLWTFFNEAVAPSLPSEVSRLVTALQRDSSAETPSIEEAAAGIKAVLGLRDTDPPPNWSSRQRARLSWVDLGDVQREVLSEARQVLIMCVPGAEMLLFGSRATGEAGPDSDYDLALVLPDNTPDRLRESAMGELWRLGQRRGIELNREPFLLKEFEDPPSINRDLVREIKDYGIAVPASMDCELPLS